MPGPGTRTDTPAPQDWSPRMLRNPNRRRAALLGVSAVSTMQMVDPSLNSTALPKAAAGLGMSTGTMTLAASIATLLLAASMLGTGSLGDLRGRRKVLLCGSFATVIGCLVTAFAPNAEIFVAGRVITGIATAAAFGMSLAIIPLIFHPHELPKAFGTWLGIQGTLIVVACLGGGGLVTHFGWRIGYLVVPVIGLIATVWAFLTVPDSRAAKARRFDTVGVLLAALALICLIEAFSQVGDHGWVSVVTLGLMAAALVLFGLFAWWERRVAEPAFPMELFSVRPFVAAIVVGILFNLGNAAVTMQYPLMVQKTLGSSAFVSSAVIAMFGAGSIAGAFGAGAFQTSRGVSDRTMFVSGLGFIAVALLAMGFTTENTPLWLFFATAAVIGFGVAWAQNPQSAVMMRSAPAAMVGSVGAVKPAVGQMGMGLGLGGLIPVVNSFTAASSGSPAHAAGRGFGLGMVLVAVLLVLGAAVIWRMMRPQGRQPGSDAAQLSGPTQDEPAGQAA